MAERPLALVADRLSRNRDACETQRVATTKDLEAAKARNEELQLELRACEADKLAAQKAVCDAHARARATKEAIALVKQQSVVAAAVLMHKEEQLLQYSECFRVLHQQTRELEEQQKTALEGAVREASDLKNEVASLRRDLGQQDVLRKQLEQAKHEASSLHDVVENARTHASAALSERDTLRRNLDELRQRLVDVEIEASALRSKASTATAGSKAAMAQLEDLRRGLKEAEQSKNVCFTELHTLRRQVDVAKYDAIDTKKQRDALQKELDAMRREGSENDTKEKHALQGVHKPATMKHVVKSLDDVEPAIGEAKYGDKSMKDRHCLEEALSKKHSLSHVGATSGKILQSSPTNGDDQKNMRSNSGGLQVQQRQQQQQQQHLDQGLPQLERQSPLPLDRQKSRLWRLGVNSSAIVKKQRRGRIEKSDLERVGYTPGCNGCRCSINGQHHQAHTEACRARVFAEMVRLNLPGARRLRNAGETKDRDPKRARVCELEIQKKQAELSTRCIISVVRASATK